LGVSATESVSRQDIIKLNVRLAFLPPSLYHCL